MLISPKVTFSALGIAFLTGCIPYQRPEHAQQMPISKSGEFVIVGTPDVFYKGVVITFDARTVAHHDGIPVEVGTSEDGMTADQLIEYLQEDIAQTDGVVERFDRPPVVRIYNGANDEDIDAVVRAVQHINAALPDTWQLTVSSLPDDSLLQRAASGEILVIFAGRDDWDFCTSGGDAVGCARVSTSIYPAGEVKSATILVDRTHLPKHGIAATVAHELLHALGRGHADFDKWNFVSDMTVHGSSASHVQVIGTLDRDALLAVYGHLEAGDTSADLHTKLGAWEHESMHLRARIPITEAPLGTGSALVDSSTRLMWFGVAERNDQLSPWAWGPAPWIPIEHNPYLEGTATWNGRLLGLTPNSSVVAGAAELDINLSMLDGTLYLTDLEQWSPRADPGAIGTGTQWGDGDLVYGVLVRDNSFIQDGNIWGDDGIVTGMFMGRMHEAMGGTIERHDLKAAFGGTRD